MKGLIMLISMFKPADNKLGYIKAIVEEDNYDFFSELGFKKTQPVLQEETPDADAEPELTMDQDPSKGFGRPGTLDWHTSHIASLESVRAIYKYANAVIGDKIYAKKDLEGATLEVAQINALARIKEHLNHDD